MRSPDTAAAHHAPILPLLAKELWEIASGRALWIMLLILCPLVGYSFFQAVSLYGEASSAGQDSPALASSLSPLDGVLVPTFGGLYLVATLLFPFVAIRTLGSEKESGALALLVQLPYRVPTLILAKMAAIFGAWLAAVICAASALAVWLALRGHLDVAETLNLLIGHLLYGLLVGAIALFSASISESAATAAIITLAFNRLLGARLCARRTARCARMDIAVVADADVARIRAGTAVGRPGVGYRRGDRWLCRACGGVAASRRAGQHQSHSLSGLRGDRCRRHSVVHAGRTLGRRHRGRPQFLFSPPIRKRLPNYVSP